MPKLVLFCQSLRSDWNHGNAHFLRGVLSECWHRGFEVLALEPANGWSAQNLVKDHGPAALEAWRETYPPLPLIIYDSGGSISIGHWRGRISFWSTNGTSRSSSPASPPTGSPAVPICCCSMTRITAW